MEQIIIPDQRSSEKSIQAGSGERRIQSSQEKYLAMCEKKLMDAFWLVQKNIFEARRARHTDKELLLKKELEIINKQIKLINENKKTLLKLALFDKKAFAEVIEACKEGYKKGKLVTDSNGDVYVVSHGNMDSSMKLNNVPHMQHHSWTLDGKWKPTGLVIEELAVSGKIPPGKTVTIVSCHIGDDKKIRTEGYSNGVKIKAVTQQAGVVSARYTEDQVKNSETDPSTIQPIAFLPKAHTA